MIINKISLRNFRQFKNAEIELSCDKNKKFTVILGDNTFGKTTLVRAFIWCLYGVNSFDDKILLNYETRQELKPNQTGETVVAIDLFHNDYNYHIVTREVYQKNISGFVSVFNKATTSVIKCGDDSNGVVLDAKSEINKILSSDLKDFFFYDGENNQIEKISSTSKLKEAVSELLGLRRIEMLADYYDPTKKESVYSKLSNKLESDDTLGAIEIDDEIAEIQGKLEKCKNDLTQYGQEMEVLNDQLKIKNDLLDANKDIESDQNRKKELERKIIQSRQNKDELFQHLVSSINKNNSWLKILFSKSYIDNNFNNIMLDSAFTSKNSLSNISEKAVDELISRGRCLCGAIITNESEAYRHLIESKQFMQPHDYGKYMSSFIDGEESAVYFSNNTRKDMVVSSDKVLHSISDLDEYKTELQEIEKRISGRLDVGEIQNDIISIKSNIKFTTKCITNIKEETIPNLQKELEKLTKKRDSLSKKSEHNLFVRKCMKYAEEIYEQAKNKISREKDSIKVNLESKTNEIFQKMYHGNRSIVVDSSFKVSTVLMDNGKLDTSTGLETVKNFAFVAGLLKLVQDRINETDIMDDSNDKPESYPLVMDAPFSSTDSKHIERICNTLPDYCNQVIVVVMKKDFNNATKLIENSIGKQYVINKQSESVATIEEV